MEQWDTIYKTNASKMLGICRRYVKDNQLAEDLMHNAFMTAMSKENTYSGKGSFEGWLRTIVINTALLHIRNNKKAAFSENEPIENYSEIPDEQECSDETQRSTIEEANFSKEELLEAIDQLPDHHKVVFNLYVLDGYTHKQIGTMLNISDGTSKSHLARARKKIQELLFLKAENRKKKRAFFFLFFTKENYIDKLYKDSFHSFEIQPQKQIQFKDGAQLVNTHQRFSILKMIGANKVMFGSVIGLITTASIISLFLYQKEVLIQKGNNENVPVKMEQQIIREPVENKRHPELLPVSRHGDSGSPNEEMLHSVQHDNNIGGSRPSKNLKHTQVKRSSQKQDVPTKSKKETTQAALPSKVSDNSKKVDSVFVKKPVIIHRQIIKHDTITVH